MLNSNLIENTIGHANIKSPYYCLEEKYFMDRSFCALSSLLYLIKYIKSEGQFWAMRGLFDFFLAFMEEDVFVQQPAFISS